MQPITFIPLFMDRVWGGRRLETLYGKSLPPGVPIGESWEVVDREDAQSVVKNGPFAGKTLHDLWVNHHEEIFGTAVVRAGEAVVQAGQAVSSPRFPLLFKLLDAEDKLSVQVHPPAAIAPELKGEPKTEMWFIAEAVPGAELFVGLNRGVTRKEFERKLESGTVAECFHRIRVRPDDAILLPSGRVHAIGAGMVIFEIQQNSDTTYRVFDWNRAGLDGKPRELHLAQSLASIDFNDFEPSLIQSEFAVAGPAKVRPLVRDPLFTVEAHQLDAGANVPLRPNKLQIILVLAGEAQLRDATGSVPLSMGQSGLIPASLRQASLQAETQVAFLRVEV